MSVNTDRDRIMDKNRMVIARRRPYLFKMENEMPTKQFAQEGRTIIEALIKVCLCKQIASQARNDVQDNNFKPSQTTSNNFKLL